MPLFVRSRSEDWSRSEGSAHSESDDALRTRFRIWVEDEVRRLERLVGENLDQWPFTLAHNAPIRIGAATVADILESDGQYRERLRDWARGMDSSDSVLFEDRSLHRDLFENVSMHLDRSFDSVLDEWAEHNSSAPRRLTLTIHKDDIVQTEGGGIWRVVDFTVADQTVTLMPFRQGNQRTLLGGNSVQPAENLLGAIIVERGSVVEYPIAVETPKSPAPTVWEHLSGEDEEIH